MRPNTDPSISKLFNAWLWLLIGLVFATVLVGGLTRLYEAGLSMVDWRPIGGILPPLTGTDWQVEFSRYQAYPQYQKVMQGISLTQFKWLFFWEWFHRIMGRIVGLVALLGALVFGVQRRWSASLVFLGVVMQGIVGWLMVQTGLVDAPSVSPYALMIHLSLATALLLLCVGLLAQSWAPLFCMKRMRYALWGLCSMLGIQIMLGAVVAGLDAGIGYNTFPLMNGQWLPIEEPHPYVMQWIHRFFGVLIGVTSIWVFFQTKGSSSALKRWCLFICVAVGMQIALGIMTLVYLVPTHLASLHQLMGLALIALVFSVAVRLRRV